MREATWSNPVFVGERLSGKLMPCLLRYGLALLLVTLAWGLRLMLDPVLGEVQAFPTFYVAVALAAWWVGWRPAVLVLLLGYVAGDWFFLPPRHSLGLRDWSHVVELLTYFSVAGTVVSLTTSSVSVALRTQFVARSL